MKTTKATIKSFIRKNIDNLYINKKSDFDGMCDCVMPVNSGFKRAERANNNLDNTLGINGCWFVGSSRDYFYDYEDGIFKGYKINNCCGSFILATKK